MSMSWTENHFILGKGHYFLEGWVGQLPISVQQELLKKGRATKAMGENAIQVLLFDLKKLFNKLLLTKKKSYKTCAKKVRKKKFSCPGKFPSSVIKLSSNCIEKVHCA